MTDLATTGLLARRRPAGLICAFCGKSQLDVKLLVAGPRVAICDECSDQAHEIIVARRDADRALREGEPHAVP